MRGVAGEVRGCPVLFQNKFLSAGVQEASPLRVEVFDLLTALRRKGC